ncbi:LysE family transporter [Flavobacterium psychrophilum]|uniref:LysE family translocator n=1 Tax=Flavobacterium psychrophilum TaxID=96345 RepID=UPI000B7C446D|nr:LysE family transporter [Flavobacterium psychrophilum]MBF1998870.1 LysE family transporter [Flavobacterium psychrophilum]MBF2081483.1 LysE family transporter [Flavobacterium psychrophilum]MCB6069563.1 LysE family transporter [Flavobacterium psychrophilum]MCB6079257.1 LysE family transporter [Flavobacterium psychrophilum]MCB6091745.1 LysE family transporter [Flavobacterium psychrophilum]
MIQYILGNGIPLGIFLSFMIGPVFFVLLEISITKGFRAALIFDLGVILADIFFISIAYLGSYRLIQSLKDDPALFILGGIIMVTYGLISFFRLRKAHKAADEEEVVELIKKDYLNLFIKGFLLNFINIGVLGFWLLIIITFVPKLQSEVPNVIWFFTTVIITYIVTDICKILLSKQLRNKLTTENIIKVKKISSILLIIFGAFLLSQGWFPSDKTFVTNTIEKIEKK